MAVHDSLRREVRMLGNELGQVLKEVGGDALFDLVEEIRKLSITRRKGDPQAETLLIDRIARMPEPDARKAARAFTMFFDLANLAEDRHRARVLRERELKSDGPRSESIGAAIARLHESGCTAEAVQSLLDRLNIELVFTAHPTEAKRRSVRSKLRRLRGFLEALDNPSLLPRERRRAERSIRSSLVSLWQTDFIRPSRPTVLNEVERGLAFTPVLWDIVPIVMDDLRQALATSYTQHEFRIPNFLRFGTWIGGDRDGNPFVTSEVTKQTLLTQRRTAIRQHEAMANMVFKVLSISDQRAEVSPILSSRIEEAIAQWPEAAKIVDTISPHEVYRRWLSVLQWRLRQTAESTLDDPLPPGAYGRACELEADLLLICESLRGHRGGLLIEGELQDWLDQVRIFGFHIARLDVRQESGKYAAALDEVLRTIGVAENYAAFDESEKQAVLLRSMHWQEEIPEAALSDETKEILALFRLLIRASHRFGPEVLGGHIVSLTHEPSDLLGPLWIWSWAQGAVGTDQPVQPLPLIPLFETINDLKRAPTTLASLLGSEAYRDAVRALGSRQIVMVGYSDSTKDGGYLAAQWWLNRAQVEMHDIAEKHGIDLVFFHGRGGSLGRGGGPAARAILSLPAKTVHGSLRMTEQGEVLAERYDDIQIAHRHLEQVTWATLLVSGLPTAPPPQSWRKRMDLAAEYAYQAYRKLVEQPDFLEYFELATPIEQIERLPIGSRPSRRGGKRTLSHLRAIPWVFSWTQNRHLLPAWYGIGTAFHQLAEGEENGWQALREMYFAWPFFRALLDNAALAMAKADMGIAKQYAALANSTNSIWPLINSEYALSVHAALRIIGIPALLDDLPWLKRSIEARNPYVDPLNLIQIELIRRLRGKPAEAPAAEIEYLQNRLRLTVQGIAAGMRTTG